MPLVELIPSTMTRHDVTDRMARVLREIGKRPVIVGDVPGFVWNRLQFALLREAARLVADGVTDAGTIDEIVRDGLARRWVALGPFEVMAVGGPRTFATVARWLFPHLSADTDADALESVGARTSGQDADGLRARRDRALIHALRRDERGGAPGDPLAASAAISDRMSG